ncbi:hypothetical protein U14_05562 [Candidatus Moduliflexus flocculans]|uniref:Uncharacterized protein n=1 Tax=Candidatus Moduliflexus flocculans TaxID=1499966 RepID=A0A081BSA2_9BACT|nr:hypothetical protein U14_05562 [Candidatus Moduliflexus flocculans]
MYGLELDSWMGCQAEIRLRPQQGITSLKFVFESHAPLHLHPLRLIFEDAQGVNIQTTHINQPGQGEAFIPLRQFDATCGEVWLTVRCSPTFRPHQLDANNPDRRELGIRVVSLRYV